MPKKVWNKEKILAELRRVRANGPKASSRVDAAARMHFGSLREALRVANLPCGTPPPTYTQWTNKSVISAIRERQKQGKNLLLTSRENRSLYEASKRKFGSWRAARTAAGLPREIPDFYKPDEVRLLIIDLYERELPLTFKSHNDVKLRRSACKHFVSWRRAVESLGLGSELRRMWTGPAVIDAILRRRALGLDLGENRKDAGLCSAAYKHFGSWQNAVRAAGMDVQVRQLWNKEKAIQRIQELANLSPGKTLWQVDSKVALASFRLFGSVRNALEAAGVDTLTNQWTSCRIISEIQARYAQGKPTRLDGCGDYRLALAAKKRFGSWNAAVRAAGLVDRFRVSMPPRHWTRQDVVEAIKQCQASGRPIGDFAKECPALMSAARRHFGRWAWAIEASGLKTRNRAWSRDNIVAEIRRRQQACQSLSSNEMDNKNLVCAAYRYFGSWPAALLAAGVTCKKRKPRVNR